MADLEHNDSCAYYLLEQIPHILTFKDVRIGFESSTDKKTNNKHSDDRNRVDLIPDCASLVPISDFLECYSLIHPVSLLACENPSNVHRT
jgi:hypothetical protein